MTTKLCDFCGKEIPANSKICPYCNKALTDNVFSYNAKDEKDINNNTLDVSKYLSNENSENSENYFDTNIYSFSQQEIEKRFERKSVIYDDEERETRNEIYRRQREHIPAQKTKEINKKRKNPIIIAAVIAIIIIIIILLIIIKPFSSDQNNIAESTSSTTQTTIITTETTTQTTTTQTTVPSTYSAQSVDLYGYLGVAYSNVSYDFGDEIKSSEPDEYYGGKKYFYDGLIISTDPNGSILSMVVDYASVSNKDMYRFKSITYYSIYDQVIAEMGTPDLDQMDSQTEPCIGYTLDEGSGQSIKFKFDTNKKVIGYDIFYAD